MPQMVSRTPVALALAVSFVIGVSTGSAGASVLCKNRRGGLLVRDVCKPREETLDPPKLDQLGLRGPAGPPGPVGPPGGGLKVLDASGAEVGLVMSLVQTGSYYGSGSSQSARVVREMMLPGGSGTEFIAFYITTQGLTTSDYACSSYYGYYTKADCTGDRFQTCEYGSCSSVAGAFLFTSLTPGPDGVACFARGGTEFQHGDFYQRTYVSGPSIDAATSQCVGAGGTLLTPVIDCGYPQFPHFCAQCCLPKSDVGVAPVHQVDLSGVGTPPFRLGR